jgi:thiol-disulfide isomerase/thioredoxin
MQRFFFRGSTFLSLATVFGGAVLAALWVPAASSHAAPPAAKSTMSAADKEKLAELKTDVDALAAIAPLEDMVTPKWKESLAPRVTPLLRKKVAVLADLEQSMNARDPGYRLSRLKDLAVLSFLGDPAADGELEQASQAAAPVDAAAGKLGLCMRDWFAKQTPEDQEKVIARIKAMAEAMPADDGIMLTCNWIAHAGAASPELAASARDIIDKDLKGPMALHFKSMPNREGKALTISGTTVVGKSFTSADWAGKVVLVDFWATWCPPCREELPRVAKLYEQYHAKGLEVIGVSCDSRKPDLVKFLAEHKEMPWPELFGPVGPLGWHSLTQKFNIQGIPTMYLIDRNGVLRSVTARQRLEKMIPQLLEEEVKPPKE